MAGLAAAAPIDGDILAAAGIVADAGAGHSHADAALGVALDGLYLSHNDNDVLYADLLAGGLVHIGSAVLGDKIFAAGLVIAEFTGLVAGEGHRDRIGRTAVSRGTVLHKERVEREVLVVLGADAAVCQILGDVRGGDIHGVLRGNTCIQTALVPPEQAGAASAQAVQGVQIVDVQILDLVISSAAAAGMDQDAVMAGHESDVIGTSAADGAEVALYAADVLIDSQHTGNAPLFQDLIDDVGLAVAGLGQGLLQVIEHDHDRAVIADVLGNCLTGEGIPSGPVHMDLRLLRRLDGIGSLFRLIGFGNVLRAGQDLGIIRFRFSLSPAGGQSQHHGQRQEKGKDSFHIGIPPLIWFPIFASNRAACSRRSLAKHVVTRFIITYF